MVSATINFAIATSRLEDRRDENSEEDSEDEENSADEEEEGRLDILLISFQLWTGHPQSSAPLHWPATLSERRI